MAYRRERGNTLLTMEKKPLTRDAGADNADGQLQKVSSRNAFDFAIHSLDHGAELEKASYKRTQAQAINERKNSRNTNLTHRPDNRQYWE